MKNRCSVIIGFLGIVLFGNIFLFSNRVFAKTELQYFTECVSQLYGSGFDRNRILQNINTTCGEWAKVTAMGRQLGYNPTFLNVNSYATDALSPEIKITSVAATPKVQFYFHSFLFNASTRSTMYQPDEFYWDTIYIARPSTEYAQLSDWSKTARWDVYSGTWPAQRWGVVSPSSGKKSPIGELDVAQFINSDETIKMRDGNEMVYTGDLRIHWCLDTTRPSYEWGGLTYPQCDDMTVELTLRVERPELQLRGIAVDPNGNVVEGVQDVVGVTREEGGEVTITRRNVGGYTFLGWKADKNPHSSFLSTDVRYTTYISENKTVYAVYEKGLDNSTLIDLVVKNDNINNNGHGENYTKYDRKMVYAKPGDKIRYKAIYFPLIQREYNLSREAIGIICDHDAPDDAWKTYNDNKIIIGSGEVTNVLFGTNLNKICGNGFSNNAASASDPWHSAFGIATDFDIRPGVRGEAYTSFGRGVVYPGGDSSKRFTAELPSKNTYTVQSGDVGRDLSATTKFNDGFGKTINYTPTQIEYVEKILNGKSYLVGYIFLQDKNRVAYARIPYNFITGVSVEDLGEDGALAGQVKNIKISVKSNDKPNTLTVNKGGSAYHTKIDNASVKLIAYQVPNDASVDNEEWESGKDEGRNLNLCGHYTGATDCREISVGSGINISETDTYTSKTEFNIPDDWAGTKICFAAAAYPAKSGVDENIEASGSKTWGISASKCYTIGKQPVFQVWGGSVYTSGDISTFVTKKLKEGDNNNLIITSSWAEQSVISNTGIVEGLASGAATGLRKKHKNVDSEPVAGSVEGKNMNNGFCFYRVPLSISNYSEGKCKGNDTSVSASAVTGVSGIDAKKPDVDLLISALENYRDNGQTSMGEIEINNTSSSISGWCGKTVCVWKRDSGNIIINGNVEYPSDGEHIRKAIIYAKEGSILINCSVKRVDAILVSKDGIKTCVGNDGSEPADVNAEVRSNLLQINGAVITDGELKLGRTYGAGKEKYSSIPAEIINYDSSIVLWWRDMLQSSKGNAFSEVYKKTLAPRY